jgi:hypothetical protein
MAILGVIFIYIFNILITQSEMRQDGRTGGQYGFLYAGGQNVKVGDRENF